MPGHPTTDHPLAYSTSPSFDMLDLHPQLKNRRRRCSSEPVKSHPQTLVSAPKTPALPSKRYHQVKPGDTLEGICVLYGVSVSDMKRINRIWNPGELFLRKVLEIPLSGAPVGSVAALPAHPPQGQQQTTITPEAEPNTITNLLTRIDQDVQHILTYLPKPSPPTPKRLYPPPQCYSLKSKTPTASPRASPKQVRVKVRSTVPAAVVSDVEMKKKDKEGEKERDTVEEVREMHQWVDMVALGASAENAEAL
ncbi:hypothetical protein SpCBS45565_g01473 [Spizellomyces sp. 'palustris']|nr:hypothetical protein SpCBS45565_g01473 [Spizellomyces sp. 'palustris']